MTTKASTGYAIVAHASGDRGKSQIDATATNSAKPKCWLAAVVASRLVPARERGTPVAPPGDIACIAVGYALVAWGFVSLDLTALDADSVLHALVLAAGVALVVTPRLGEEPLVETR